MNVHWSDYERFLKPVHLAGQAVTLTIVGVTEEETHPQKGKTVTAPVLWFREKPFGLILSPTNRQILIALYGDAIEACKGQSITVQAITIRVAGSDRQPIRILRQRPAAPRVEPATGEIIEPPRPAPVEDESGREGVTELDAHFGSPKLTAAEPPAPDAPPPPDFCTTHNVTMTETSPKTGLPYHRLTTEDGRVGFCNGHEVKFAGNGHAASGK